MYLDCSLSEKKIFWSQDVLCLQIFKSKLKYKIGPFHMTYPSTILDTVSFSDTRSCRTSTASLTLFTYENNLSSLWWQPKLSFGNKKLKYILMELHESQMGMQCHIHVCIQWFTYIRINDFKECPIWHQRNVGISTAMRKKSNMTFNSKPSATGNSCNTPSTGWVNLFCIKN